MMIWARWMRPVGEENTPFSASGVTIRVLSTELNNISAPVILEYIAHPRYRGSTAKRWASTKHAAGSTMLKTTSPLIPCTHPCRTQCHVWHDPCRAHSARRGVGPLVVCSSVVCAILYQG